MTSSISQHDFFKNNNIKWFPILLVNKHPVEIKHDCYKRLSVKDGTITYAPNFTEFKTIDYTTLQQRQDLFGGIPFNAIDTYEIAQIDIDTPNICQEWLKTILSNTPYYKSVSKPYGYHIFVRLSDFQPTKTTYQFKSVFPLINGDELAEDFDNAENYYRVMPDEDAGKLELLTGKWGYINKDTEIINADKKIIDILNIADCLVSTNNKIQKTRPIDDPPAYTEHVETPLLEQKDASKPSFVENEIRLHMLNISQNYIDCYDDHIKIINAILRTGYETIAMECMNRSTNDKNKDLTKEYEKFKNSKLYDIKPATLFYYSQISNREQFFKIHQQYQYHQLRENGRKYLFDLVSNAKTIHCQYIDPNLILNVLDDEMKDYFTTLLDATKGRTIIPKILHLQSPMGTGKTTMMKTFFKTYPLCSVLYCSPRRTFSNDVHADLQYSGFHHYKNLKQYQKNNDGDIPTRIICQIESLHKLKGQTYDIVIVDEIESDLSQLLSVDTNKKIFDNTLIFERFINDAKLVVCLDAFLSSHSQKIIEEIKPQTTTITIQNTYKTKQDWIAVENDKLKTLYDKALADIELGNKIVFVSGIKKVAIDFKNKVLEQFPNTKILLYTADTDDKDKQFNDINNEWIKYDVLVYSTVITCGVSFDPEIPHFDMLYAYISPNGASTRDLHQSLQRVRKFKTNKLEFCVDKNIYIIDKPYISTDYEETRTNVMNNIELKRKTNTITQSLPTWAIHNSVHNHYLENLNTVLPLGMFCEYLRFQGYTIRYCDYSNGLKMDAYAMFIQSTDAYEESKMTKEEYKNLQNNSFDLTETQKFKIRHYEFEQSLDFLELTNEDKTTLYKNLRTKTEHLKMMFKPEKVIDDDTLRKIQIDAGKLEVVDLTSSIVKIQYKKIQELCVILRCPTVYELEYTSDTLLKNHDRLLKWIAESEHLFNCRKTRGDEPLRYVNSIIKNITRDFCGLEVEGKRTSVKKNGEKNNIWKYTNMKTKNGKNKELYQLFKTLE